MKKITRLQFLKASGLATASLMLNEKATAGSFHYSGEKTVVKNSSPDLGTLKSPVTAKGKIKGLEFSRLILGGNPIGGWLHSRDLKYVGPLAKAYLTDEKKMEIFRMAEDCGIDTILGHPIMIDILNKYWSTGRGKIKWISDCGGRDFVTAAQQSIDGGCMAGYCQGENADRYVANGDFKTIEKGLDILRKAGMPAGIGAHRIETIKACIENGLIPDFWMKTLHHHNYWSARPNEPANDNRYCEKPEETIAFMESRPEPFIAFKVLAAGAIPPADGIRYGLENGGDFICLGMFDFNMIEDVNIFNETLASLGHRKRPWQA
ncbi:hypothetical protein [Parabacteroides sp. PF5-9]|uniref:hypothetical protein n=1 Tax=Parabacteroides sp. PF5-9 TaxID=1742404 RepID=UPI002473D541|nr:hypothetical protein [Parabacteroides sp. PF5-9]MDH6359090.1 hypothetical protein [Parabacteroides sp. PF5-9]